MVERASNSPPPSVLEPSEPPPTPMNTSDSPRARSNTPGSVTPLNTTNAVSYGSVKGKQSPAWQLQREAGPVDAAEAVLKKIRDGTSDARQPGSRWLRNINYAPYLLLENSGSVARDHLASERTFLAYVRTSLALASAGVALVQLLSVSSSLRPPDQATLDLFRFARPLGAVLIIVGILVQCIGSFRYFRVQGALISGKFPLARFAIIFICSTVTVLVAVVFGALLQGSR